MINVDIILENKINGFAVKALKAAMKQYRELMTPVYQAGGIRNTANGNFLTNVLNQDISGFVKQIANANAVNGNVGNTFNYVL